MFNEALLVYLTALKAEGFTRLHVGEVVPTGVQLPAGVMRRT